MAGLARHRAGTPAIRGPYCGLSLVCDLESDLTAFRVTMPQMNWKIGGKASTTTHVQMA